MKREYDFTKGKRGAVVPVQPGKTRVTIRLDTDTLDWFRHQVDEAGGGNYQTLINTALREHIARKREPLESTIRRVIREELRRDGGVNRKLAEAHHPTFQLARKGHPSRSRGDVLK